MIETANPSPRPFSDAPPRRRVLLAAASLAVAALLAYANSFSVPFVFDDVPSIPGNPSIRQLSTALSPPEELLGLPVGARPLVNLSLAFNYALGGTSPVGYHAVNLLIHVLAALALFVLVRRTLLLPSLRARFGGSALPLAFCVALLWVLHPLQTESVTYVCQRAESLMALCYLVTLYLFARSVESASPGRWQALAVVACLVGMACKEVMVSAPLIVLLYDRTFVAGSFGTAWRQRWRTHAALAATWLLLAALVLGNARRGGTAGLGTGVSPWDYALTQAQAIPRYLALALWPRPLVFDYGIDFTTTLAAAALPALVPLGLLALTLRALWKRPAAGFVGAVFFAVLAPTSSVVPISTQTTAEHRMYLPLAAVAVLAVLALHALAGRRTLLVCLALAAALGASTVARNADYRTELGLWADTVEKLPTNSRAHGNLAILLFKASRTDEALGHFETALRLRPQFPEARANLASALLTLGRPQEAALQANEALLLKPDFPDARNTLGLALKQLGRVDEAAEIFRAIVRQHPEHAEAHHNLAIILLERGQLPESIGEFETTLRLNPDFADAHGNFGVALARAGRFDEAIGHYETTLRLNPSQETARGNLAALRAELSRRQGAK